MWLTSFGYECAEMKALQEEEEAVLVDTVAVSVLSRWEQNVQTTNREQCEIQRKKIKIFKPLNAPTFELLYYVSLHQLTFVHHQWIFCKCLHICIGGI